MQVTQTDAKNTRRVGVKEELIKFRPSPNFKNMKKFLKNRSDYTDSTLLAALQEPVVQQIPEQKVEVKPVVFQPPLPTYPPPPDSPPLKIVIKQEVEDNDTQNGDDEPEKINQEQPPAEPDRTESEGPKKTMCKEWFRGDCKRTVCRFSHELDLNQLPGIFTFCWNYQNKKFCPHPNCKFVHASIFEEAEFYRTAILPAHARSHLIKQPPPPPPLQENQAAPFVNPPPLVHPTVEKPMPVVIPEFGNIVPRSTSPLKREWNEVDEFSNATCDFEHKEQKKCKSCSLTDIRLQSNKGMVETLKQSKEEMSKKINVIDLKQQKLSQVLQIVLKPAKNAKGIITNNIISTNTDKSYLEQLNELSNIISTNNRMSSTNTDEQVKLLSNIMGLKINLSALMASMLCDPTDATISQDTSRET